MKICVDCKKEKPIEGFTKRPNYNNSGTVYYKSQCKDCDTFRMKQWREKNRERYNAYIREYNRKRKV